MGLQGVPLRIELGMKDVEKQSVMSARRDTGAKEVIPFADIVNRVPALLEQIQVLILLRHPSCRLLRIPQDAHASPVAHDQ